MKSPKQVQAPKRHTIAYRQVTRWARGFCTTCGKDIDYRDVNKRCKGGKR